MRVMSVNRIGIIIYIRLWSEKLQRADAKRVAIDHARIALRVPIYTRFCNGNF